MLKTIYYEPIDPNTERGLKGMIDKLCFALESYLTPATGHEFDAESTVNQWSEGECLKLIEEARKLL
jgi:hypothetical protein